MADEAKTSCEKNILSALRGSAKIKLILGALKSSGCEVIPHRHIACASCDESLSGGYDEAANQIVICYNVCKSPEKVEEILAHELIHLYDFCTTKINFQDVDHLACTEIRAANLTSCKLPTLDQMSHEACVKHKAAMSVSVIKGCPISDAMTSVNKVYSKCVKDLEPIGRNRLFGAKSDCLALREFLHFRVSHTK